MVYIAAGAGGASTRERNIAQDEDDVMRSIRPLIAQCWSWGALIRRKSWGSGRRAAGLGRKFDATLNEG